MDNSDEDDMPVNALSLQLKKVKLRGASTDSAGEYYETHSDTFVSRISLHCYSETAE